VHSFFASIRYSEPIHAWEPPGDTLIEYSQDHPLFDVARAILATEFPRRKFDTHRRITVGGLKAHSGSYWTGAERHLGLAQLDELGGKRRLGFVEGGHVMSRKLGRTDGSDGADDYVSVSVRVEFTRPVSASPGALLHLGIVGGWGPHTPNLIDAAWRAFCDLLDMAPVSTGRGYWDGARSVALQDGDFPMGNVLYLPSTVVASFGGPEQAAHQVDAIDVHPVGGESQANGLAVRLWQRPHDATAARQSELAELLHRHGMPTTS
jgi:hypothetical protein